MRSAAHAAVPAKHAPGSRRQHTSSPAGSAATLRTTVERRSQTERAEQPQLENPQALRGRAAGIEPRQKLVEPDEDRLFGLPGRTQPIAKLDGVSGVGGLREIRGQARPIGARVEPLEAEQLRAGTLA